MRKRTSTVQTRRCQTRKVPLDGVARPPLQGSNPTRGPGEAAVRINPIKSLEHLVSMVSKLCRAHHRLVKILNSPPPCHLQRHNPTFEGVYF